MTTIKEAAKKWGNDPIARNLIEELYAVDEINLRRLTNDEFVIGEKLRLEGILMKSLGYPSYKISPAGARVREEWFLVNESN